MLDASSAAGVELVAVSNTPDAYRRLSTPLPRSGPARAALGMHPLHAHQLGMAGVLRCTRHAAQASWIGEIGLDFSPAGRATRDTQLAVFDALLALPRLRDRPVTVHTRGAERITVQRLADAGPGPSCTGTPARSASRTTPWQPACPSRSTLRWFRRRRDERC